MSNSFLKISFTYIHTHKTQKKKIKIRIKKNSKLLFDV